MLQEPQLPQGKSIDAAGAGATMSSPAWLTQLNLLWGGKGVRLAHWHISQLGRQSGCIYISVAAGAFVGAHAGLFEVWRQRHHAAASMQQQTCSTLCIVPLIICHLRPAHCTPCTFVYATTQNIPVADAKPEDIQDLLGGALFKALFKWFTESGPVYLLPTGPVSSFLVISDPAAAKHVLRATDNSQRNIYDKGLVAEVSKFLFGEGFAVAGGEQWRARRRAVSPSLHRYGGVKV